jgi:uncharacterized tellurite resistance protein B-like protein
MKLEDILDLARFVHKLHKEHRTIPVTITQSADDLGIALLADFQAALPLDVVVLGRVKSFWWGDLSAVDNVLFRDGAGDFVTLGPVQQSRGLIYIPYGAVRHRNPGLYVLELTVFLPSTDGSTSVAIGEASYKIALPGPRPWHKLEYLWPLVGLCMAVIRADNQVLPGEVRGLKDLMVSTFHLQAEDMEGLRAAMKHTNFGTLESLLASLRARMPLLFPEGLITLLLQVARVDGALNTREHDVLQQIAGHIGLPMHRWDHLLALPTGSGGGMSIKQG